MSTNIYVKLAKARSMFLASGAKKSGVNAFAKFNYFELEDIIPQKTAIFEKIGLVDTVNFVTEQIGDAYVDCAVLTVYNTENPDEHITFRTPVNYDGKGQNPIQNIGSVHTYTRRYLYLLCLDICECDEINATIGKDDKNTAPKSAPKKAEKNASEHPDYKVLMQKAEEFGKATNYPVDKVIQGITKKVGKPLTFETVVTYIEFLNEKMKVA